MRPTAHFSALILLLFTPAAGTAEDALRVVTSFSILQDLTEELAGEHVQVETLVGPDADAHVFEPAPRHARMVGQADLVVINGLGFEGWMERLIAASGFSGTVVRASDGIRPLEASDALHDGHHHHGPHDNGHDPHAWHDAGLVRTYVRNIADALAEVDPADAEGYARRADDLDTRLAALDQWIRQTLEPVPEEERRVITNHDAFSYYGRAYDVDFLFPVGWSTDAEPSASTVAALIRQLREDRVRVLFTENIADARLLQRIAAEGHGVIGGVLYSDALSGPDGPAPTYEAMMRHNTRTLADALIEAGGSNDTAD